MKKISLLLLNLLILFVVFSCTVEPPKEPGNIYNITYEKDGGSFVSSPFTKARKGVYVPIPEIRKTGYTLQRWTGAEQSSDSSWGFTMKSQDASLKAVWEADTYTVSYDLNGGEWVTDPPSGSAQTDSDVYIDEKPQLDGFFFVKWTSDDVKLDLTKYGYHFKMPSRNVSLKAEYSAQRYEITYNLNGGDFDEQWYPESAYKDEEVFILASPIRLGYSFDGWESSDVTITTDDDIPYFIMPNNNVSLNAKWKADIIELEWFGTGDTSVPHMGTTDEVITLPTGLVRENYDFKEWRITPDTLSEDKTKFTVLPKDRNNKYMVIDAVWIGKKFNITYEIGEGAVWSEPPKTEGNLFSELIIPELTKEGFFVTGWNSSDPNDEIKKMPRDDVNIYRLFRMSGEDITLTPVYEVRINYNFVNDNVKILEGYDTTALPYSVVRLPRCECEGYRFLGWKDSTTGMVVEEKDGGWYIPVGNQSITVEALWQKISILKFYNGDELLYSIEVKDGGSVRMPWPPSGGPEGAVFISWYNMDAGEGNYLQAKTKYIPSSSVSFKAIWGYPLEGYIIYDDPDARDENIVYTFFNWLNEYTPYDPGKAGDPNYDAYYYSVELKNGAKITKDRFYILNSCAHSWKSDEYGMPWTFFENGRYQYYTTGACKRELGDGRYNTQLVLGLIKEGEEAKRGIANINTASKYTQKYDGAVTDYSIWGYLQQLNQTCTHHDWYIPSDKEALMIKNYLKTEEWIWTSTEYSIDPQHSVYTVNYDKKGEYSYASTWAKDNFSSKKMKYYLKSIRTI